jgi:hypothetical protein
MIATRATGQHSTNNKHHATISNSVFMRASPSW